MTRQLNLVRTCLCLASLSLPSTVALPTSSPTGDPTSPPTMLEYDGTAPVTMRARDSWSLAYPLCPNGASADFYAKVDIELQALTTECDLVFAIGTDMDYVVGTIAWDGGIYVNPATKAVDTAWMAPANGEALYSAASQPGGVASIYSSDWRTSLIPSGSASEWTTWPNIAKGMGLNTHALKIAVTNKGGSVQLRLLKNGIWLTRSFSSPFGSAADLTLYLAVDSIKASEQMLVSSISSGCAGLAAAHADGGVYEEPDDDAFPGIDINTGVEGYPGAADYQPRSFVTGANVAAFLVGANVVCLAVNCLGKRKRRQRAYKAVAVDSGMESDNEMAQLA